MGEVAERQGRGVGRVWRRRRLGQAQEALHHDLDLLHERRLLDLNLVDALDVFHDDGGRLLDVLRLLNV